MRRGSRSRRRRWCVLVGHGADEGDESSDDGRGEPEGRLRAPRWAAHRAARAEGAPRVRVRRLSAGRVPAWRSPAGGWADAPHGVRHRHRRWRVGGSLGVLGCGGAVGYPRCPRVTVPVPAAGRPGAVVVPPGWDTPRAAPELGHISGYGR